MEYSYFPGCTLRNKAKDLDAYARASAEALGLSLIEPEDWQCCGGVYPLSKDEIAVRLSSVRALSDAEKHGRALVTICSACHNVIKQVNGDMRSGGEIAGKVNRYLAQEGAAEYSGRTEVFHYLELLRDVIGWDALRAKVTNPLTGRKIAAYYGCLLLRPARVMRMDDPENPRIMEDFITAIGAEPVLYGLRNECCGAYTVFEDPSIPERRARAILDNAAENGADMMITACPLCRYNLVKNSGGGKLRVFYFTELLAEALGVKEKAPAETEAFYAAK